MMTFLAIIGAVIGLVVTGSAVYLAVIVTMRPAGAQTADVSFNELPSTDVAPRTAASTETTSAETTSTEAISTDATAAPAPAEPEDKPAILDRLRQAVPQLLQWTFFDYALLALFLIGSLFLFTDLVAVLRDLESFPPYHAPYLICGFIFTLAATLMMLVRLALVLAVARGERLPSAEHQKHQPGHTHHAE
jgi:hypothetical protein